MKLDDLDFDSDPTKAWSHLMHEATNLDKLKVDIKDWGWIAKDAIKIINKLDESAFQKLRESFKKERSGEFSNDKTAAVVLMPEAMFKVSMVQMQCGVPWVTAYQRMKKLKKI